MTHRLTKHHGLGNDFLVHLTDDAALAADRGAWSERARAWCHRSRGIGADGLLIGLWGRPGADLVMTLVNADGSFAEMSGNGIRCLVQAEAMRRGVESADIEVETDGGIRRVAIGPDPSGHPHTAVASVDMGAVGPGPVPAGGSLVRSPAMGPEPLKSATLDLGNPHLVALVEDPAEIDLSSAGAAYEAAFPGGVNVSFVAPTPGEADALTMRVWERGAGITEACGTGATASAHLASQWGLVGERVTVHMPGGDVAVEVGGPTPVLHGPTVFVAHVQVPA